MEPSEWLIPLGRKIEELGRKIREFGELREYDCPYREGRPGVCKPCDRHKLVAGGWQCPERVGGELKKHA